MLRHVGDIAASWALQVGIRAFPDLRSPLLDRIAGVIESRNVLSHFGLYISERLGILLLPSLLTALVRHPDVEF